MTDLDARRRTWIEGVASSRRRQTTRLSQHTKTLTKLLQQLVVPHSRILQLGCGKGHVLAALRPAHGVGVEIAHENVKEATESHANEKEPGKLDLEFIEADPEHFRSREPFDYVIASDLLNDCFDVDDLLQSVYECCQPYTRVVITNYSQLWRPVLKLARFLGLAHPRFGDTWFSPEDLQAALSRNRFEVISDSPETLLPIQIPLVTGIANRLLARLPFLRSFCLHRVILARALFPPADPAPSVTVLVPARNEAGNIERILAEVPEMGAFTELIFVEGNSTDNTWAVLEKAVAERNCPNVRLLKQPGKGKGDAVRHGFAAARGDILMILDADLTVPAEMLPRFYNAVASGHAEFANGTRLVYRMDEKAMQFLNLLANHFFAHAFTFVLSQPVRDTLCGTKALSRRSYEKIVAQREYFGDFDPFGDFDLLFGAARLGLRIRDIPIRYRERVYGETNISRFRHGIMLFRMLWIAALKLKFR